MVGPVIIIIGMGLAPVAVDMALGKNSNYDQAILVSMITLLTTLCVAVFAKGIMKLIPIMFGIAAGYIVCAFMG